MTICSNRTDQPGPLASCSRRPDHAMTAAVCTCIREIGTVDGLVAWTIAVRDDERPTVEHRTRVGA